MQWSPGSDAELTSTFTLADGTPVDPETINCDLYGPDGLLIDNGQPERISTGFYVYTYPIPVDAETGLYRIEWQAIVNGLNAFGTEDFEVASAGVIVNPSASILHARLRSRLAESKTDPTGDGSETFFDDVAITDLLSYSDNDLDLATLEGWRRKMARYARLVDVSESGADRKMSQKFKQAKSMADFWEKYIGDATTARSMALRGRVVGRPVNLRRDDEKPVLTPFSGYTDHVRMYPTHRLLIPAILN